MRSRRAIDVCYIERSASFPPPVNLQQILDTSQSILAVSTILRDPWKRFCSNFQREYELVQKYRRVHLTIEEYTNETYVHSDLGFNLRKWGSYNRPNFYVRLLSGYGADAEHAIGTRDLGVATKLLSSMQYVFVLERIETQSLLLGSLIESPSPQHFPQLSNNKFSPAKTAARRGRGMQPARPPACDQYRATFQRQNELDDALYNHAVVLVEERQKGGADRRLRAVPTRRAIAR